MKNQKGISTRDNPSVRIKNTTAGITLIALVITIIVLLILAGVSISMVIGNNGILNQASTAGVETEKASEKEQVEMAYLAASIENYGDSPQINKVQSEIDKLAGEGNAQVTQNEDGTFNIKYLYTGRSYVVGNVNVNGGSVLPSTTDTIPFGLEDAIVLNNDLETGLVIKDSNDNEWVWVEVPKSIYNNVVYNSNGVNKPSNSDDYTNIEIVLKNYTSAYSADNVSDTWYSEDAHGFTSSTDYDNYKNNMLKSVYENGGFYIARYEAGTQIARTSESDSLTTPVIKQDVYPYGYLTAKQAQSLSTQLSTSDRTTSLIFGIQWKLTLKFMEEKGYLNDGTKVTQDMLNENSTTWANYNYVTFDISRGKYSLNNSWNDVNSTYTKPLGTSVLLTTGASERNKVLNIYDLAGNMGEWTLEYSSTTTGYPCVYRGGTSGSYDGYADYQGWLVSANVASNSKIDKCVNAFGFRPVMY